MRKKNHSKWALFVTFFVGMLALSGSTVQAGNFVSGSTGADGAFAPTVNTELQLPPNGVFNFTIVDIPTGVTVTFKSNAANTPLYILATGDVNIAGTISVNGEDGKDGSTGTGNIGEGTIPVYGGKGGQGGFDGGRGGQYGTIAYPALLPSAGLGPGGGKICTNYSSPAPSGGGGGYANSGATSNYTFDYGWGGSVYSCAPGGIPYGSESLLPLLGGAGGGGGLSSINNGGGGGGGGGAILIASTGAINVSGTIMANGGIGGNGDGYGGGSSGGAIRLLSNKIMGNGNLFVNGGSGGGRSWYQGSGTVTVNGGSGSTGRIRLEAYTFERTAQTNPAASTGKPGSVFVANLPTLAITSIGGTSISGTAAGSYDTPDITLPSTTTNPVTLNISANNIPVGTTVTVMVVPKSGASSTFISTPLSGSNASSSATVDVTLPSGVAAIIQAAATFTVTQTASNPAPLYADGERVIQIKVASAIGGKSSVTYITESGREVQVSM